MTLNEAIRETWSMMRPGPVPTAVEELKSQRDSGYGATTSGDEWRVFVAIEANAVRVGCESVREPAICGEGRYTHREFLELIAEPAQRSLFDGAAS